MLLTDFFKSRFIPKKFQPFSPIVQALKSTLTFTSTSVSMDDLNNSNYSRSVFCGYPQSTLINQLNHEVIAVGYDAHGNWIFINIWSAYWDERCYIGLYQNSHNYGIFLDKPVARERQFILKQND